jgi:HK97 gp10 family phage protein
VANAVQIMGEAALLKKLKGLDRKVRTKIVRKAISEATKPVYKSMRARCPKGQGHLRKSIARKVKVYRSGKNTVGLVGPRFNYKGRQKGIEPNLYAHLVEFGTTAHEIAITEGPLKGLVIQHPGARAQPFIRPALDDNAKVCQEIMAREVEAGIHREAAG